MPKLAMQRGGAQRGKDPAAVAEDPGGGGGGVEVAAGGSAGGNPVAEGSVAVVPAAGGSVAVGSAGGVGQKPGETKMKKKKTRRGRRRRRRPAMPALEPVVSTFGAEDELSFSVTQDPREIQTISGGQERQQYIPNKLSTAFKKFLVESAGAGSPLDMSRQYVLSKLEEGGGGGAEAGESKSFNAKQLVSPYKVNRGSLEESVKSVLKDSYHQMMLLMNMNKLRIFETTDFFNLPVVGVGGVGEPPRSDFFEEVNRQNEVFMFDLIFKTLGSNIQILVNLFNGEKINYYLGGGYAWSLNSQHQYLSSDLDFCVLCPDDIGEKEDLINKLKMFISCAFGDNIGQEGVGEYIKGIGDRTTQTQTEKNLGHFLHITYGLDPTNIYLSIFAPPTEDHIKLSVFSNSRQIPIFTFMEFSLEEAPIYDLMFDPMFETSGLVMELQPLGFDSILQGAPVLTQRGCVFKLLGNLCQEQNLIVRFHNCERNIFIGKFLSWMTQCGIALSWIESLDLEDINAFLKARTLRTEIREFGEGLTEVMGPIEGESLGGRSTGGYLDIEAEEEGSFGVPTDKPMPASGGTEGGR